MELQEPTLEKLKLDFQPYTYVRTVVMRSLLFRKEDYHKMLKMSFGEIASFLQESHYKKEINALATEYAGSDLLELALNRNLAESFKKLIRISHYGLESLIKEYIKRKDIEDIKTIIRGKFTNANEKLIANSITSAGTLSHDFLISLMKKESVEEILKSSKIMNFQSLKDGLIELREKNSLMGIENALDRHYYTKLIQFSKTLPKEGELFKDFLLKEVEILNLLTLLRLKKANATKESIKNFIILSGDKLNDSKIIGLASLEDLDMISKALEKREYKNAIAKGFEEFRKSGSLITLEIELYKHLLRQSMLLQHQHPLSVDVILGYMFAKDIEARNLRIIIKGKQLGLKEDFIENQLIF